MSEICSIVCVCVGPFDLILLRKILLRVIRFGKKVARGRRPRTMSEARSAESNGATGQN